MEATAVEFEETAVNLRGKLLEQKVWAVVSEALPSPGTPLWEKDGSTGGLPGVPGLQRGQLINQSSRQQQHPPLPRHGHCNSAACLLVPPWVRCDGW